MATPSIEVQAGDRSVRVTNPDKVYFPQAGITKRDLVEYYATVGVRRSARSRDVR